MLTTEDGVHCTLRLVQVELNDEARLVPTELNDETRLVPIELNEERVFSFPSLLSLSEFEIVDHRM